MESSTYSTVEALKTIINLAYKESNPQRLNQIVSVIYSRADIRQVSLTKTEIEKLIKLSHQAEDLPTSFSVALIYNFIFAYHLINVDNFDPDFVLSIINVLLPLHEKLHGTILSRRIQVHLKKLLYNLTKRKELPLEDKTTIYTMLKDPEIKMDNVYTNFEDNALISECRTLLKTRQNFQKTTAVTHIMNVITECSSLEEQLSVFYKRIINVLKGGNINADDHSKDLVQLLGYFVDHMFFETEFLVRLSPNIFDPSKNLKTDPLFYMNFETDPMFIKQRERTAEIESNHHDYKIIPYRLTEQESTLKLSDNIYPAVAFFINTFLNYPKNIEIQRLSVTLLQRLYYNFPKFRKNIEDALMSIFSFINEDVYVENKREAAVFLYKLVNRDATPEFKQLLQSKNLFKSLEETVYYRPSVLNKSENIIESTTPKELVIKAGFPQTKNIPSGNIYNTYIEVWKPFSIVYWAFALADYDISFSLTQVASFDDMMKEQKTEPFLIYQAKKIEASKNQYKGTLIAKEPGIYKLTFDNSGSWFNSKSIKLLVYVLEPELDIVPFGPPGAVVQQQTETLDTSKEEIIEGNEVHSERERNVLRKSSSVLNAQELLETTAIIHLDRYNINFKVESKQKSYELQFGYPSTEEEWNETNKEMLETTRKGLKAADSSQENSLIVKFIYNPKILKEKFLTENSGFDNATISKALTSTFTFLESLQNRIIEEMELTTEAEYIIRDLLWNNIYGYDDSVYVLCLDNAAQNFAGSYRRHNAEYKSHDFNNVCIPQFENEEYQLKNLNELYFGEKSAERKLGYLACLLINIFEFYEGRVKRIVIFEDKHTDLIAENQTKILESLKNYVNNRNQNAEKLDLPTIDFRRVKIQELLKF